MRRPNTPSQRRSARSQSRAPMPRADAGTHPSRGTLQLPSIGHRHGLARSRVRAFPMRATNNRMVSRSGEWWARRHCRLCLSALSARQLPPRPLPPSTHPCQVWHALRGRVPHNPPPCLQEHALDGWTVRRSCGCPVLRLRQLVLRLLTLFTFITSVNRHNQPSQLWYSTWGQLRRYPLGQHSYPFEFINIIGCKH